MSDQAWLEVTEEDRMNALEALPPVYFPGGFCMGEPAAHDERDMPIFTAYVKVRGRCFCRDLAIDKAEAAARELRDSLGA